VFSPIGWNNFLTGEEAVRCKTHASDREGVLSVHCTRERCRVTQQMTAYPLFWGEFPKMADKENGMRDF